MLFFLFFDQKYTATDVHIYQIFPKRKRAKSKHEMSSRHILIDRLENEFIYAYHMLTLLTFYHYLLTYTHFAQFTLRQRLSLWIIHWINDLPFKSFKLVLLNWFVFKQLLPINLMENNNNYVNLTRGCLSTRFYLLISNPMNATKPENNFK